MLSNRCDIAGPKTVSAAWLRAGDRTALHKRVTALKKGAKCEWGVSAGGAEASAESPGDRWQVAAGKGGGIS